MLFECRTDRTGTCQEFPDHSLDLFTKAQLYQIGAEDSGIGEDAVQLPIYAVGVAQLHAAELFL